MKFWQSPPDSAPKFHFGTPSNCQPKNEGCQIFEPSKGWTFSNLREVWQYRELLFLLVWRDTVVRYKQSVIGIGWAIIR